MLTVAPVTASPGAASTGTDSPVKSEVSRAEEPSTMMPSVATFSPGRTANRSPTCRDEAGTTLSVRSPVAGSTLTSVASFAPMLSRVRSASEERLRVRCSIARPISRNSVTMDAESKYSGAWLPVNIDQKLPPA